MEYISEVLAWIILLALIGWAAGGIVKTMGVNHHMKNRDPDGRKN